MICSSDFRECIFSLLMSKYYKSRSVCLVLQLMATFICRMCFNFMKTLLLRFKLFSTFHLHTFQQKHFLIKEELAISPNFLHEEGFF